MNGGDDDERGLLWKLPMVKSSDFGKLGPAFGVGAGCGVGFGVGLLGGTFHFLRNQPEPYHVNFFFFPTTTEILFSYFTLMFAYAVPKLKNLLVKLKIGGFS